MRIGLNATCLSERPSGAKQRFIGIYNALFERMPDVEFTIYQAENCDLRKSFRPFPNVTFIDTPIPADGRIMKYFISLVYWRKVFKHSHFDLFEGYHLPFTASPSGKNILTMHDIRGVSYYSGPLERLQFGTVLSNAFSRADHVISVSEAMRADILEFSPGMDVSVIYNGIEAAGFAAVDAQRMAKVSEKLGLSGDFILTVGHFEKRKNYARLIEALAGLHKAGKVINLVMVGNDSGEMQAIRKLIDTLGLTAHVIILSGISDDTVRCLYKLARLFVFPSYYEGFGIPVLEAMAAGCPMVLSDIPVFREITQNKVRYFKYDDVPALVEAIQKSFDSPEDIQSMVAYGSSRVADFGFKRIAIELERLYRKILVLHES